jgi:hypothetical protein
MFFSFPWWETVTVRPFTPCTASATVVVALPGFRSHPKLPSRYFQRGSEISTSSAIALVLLNSEVMPTSSPGLPADAAPHPPTQLNEGCSAL